MNNEELLVAASQYDLRPEDYNGDINLNVARRVLNRQDITAEEIEIVKQARHVRNFGTLV